MHSCGSLFCHPWFLGTSAMDDKTLIQTHTLTIEEASKVRLPISGVINPLKAYPCRLRALTLWWLRLHVTPCHLKKWVELFQEAKTLKGLFSTASLNLRDDNWSVSFPKALAVLLGCKHSRVAEKRTTWVHVNQNEEFLIHLVIVVENLNQMKTAWYKVELL